MKPFTLSLMLLTCLAFTGCGGRTGNTSVGDSADQSAMEAYEAQLKAEQDAANDTEKAAPGN